MKKSILFLISAIVICLALNVNVYAEYQNQDYVIDGETYQITEYTHIKPYTYGGESEIVVLEVIYDWGYAPDDDSSIDFFSSDYYLIDKIYEDTKTVDCISVDFYPCDGENVYEDEDEHYSIYKMTFEIENGTYVFGTTETQDTLFTIGHDYKEVSMQLIDHDDLGDNEESNHFFSTMNGDIAVVFYNGEGRSASIDEKLNEIANEILEDYEGQNVEDEINESINVDENSNDEETTYNETTYNETICDEETLMNETDNIVIEETSATMQNQQTSGNENSIENNGNRTVIFVLCGVAIVAVVAAVIVVLKKKIK